MRMLSKKPNRPRRVLAIDPGTREMGVALLEAGQLLYHGVKVFPTQDRSARDRLTRAVTSVQRMIVDFKPSVLVIEKTFFAANRNVALLNVLADEICLIARRDGLCVLRFAPSTVKKRIAGTGRASKMDVAKVVVARFPELTVYLGQRRKWQEDFHGNMFDAVALGLMAPE